MRIKPTEQKVVELLQRIEVLLNEPNKEIVESQPGKPEDEVGQEGRNQLFDQLDRIKERTRALIKKKDFSESEMRNEFNGFSDFITEVSNKYVGHTSREEDSIRQWLHSLRCYLMCASANW